MPAPAPTSPSTSPAASPPPTPPPPAAVKQHVRLTPTVRPKVGSTPPAGTIPFFDGPTQLAAPGPLTNGTATFPSRTFSGTGTHTLRADYAPPPPQGDFI